MNETFIQEMFSESLVNTDYLQIWLDGAVKLKGIIFTSKKVGLSVVSPKNLSVDLHSVKYFF